MEHHKIWVSSFIILGLWWSDRRQYKNAIPNEQYIKLSAQLHNRIPGDTKYLEQSANLWTWFRNVGMINDENLINDGLHECKNNRQETWTYNQGVILGGLVELFQATKNETYVDEARKIADAVLRSTHLNDEHGVLYEPCTEEDCGPNAPCFKGIFIRLMRASCWKAIFQKNILNEVMHDILII